MMPNALMINNLAKETDKYEMNFATEYMIENTSDKEIVVNDLNRGLVWYIPPQSYLLLNMGKLPQACLLRIANTDPLHPAIKYVTIGSASFSLKFTIAYEDEDCWIFLLNEESQDDNDDEIPDFSRLMGVSNNTLRVRYIKRDKDSFQDTHMVEEEVFAIIKKAREMRDKKK